MLNKLSSCEPGQIVHGIDLSAYRVASKVAGPEGVVVKLASLSGEPVSLPADFTLIGPRMAHFASAMFFHLAYDKDLDLYVRARCEQMGLPVPIGPDGQPFRWADWFQKTIAPKLISPIRGGDSNAIKDDAIHEMLFNTLFQRNILGDFKKSIKKFPKDIKKLPAAKQLTVYLAKNFRWRVEEMNRKLKEQYGWPSGGGTPKERAKYPQWVSMFQPGKEGEEFNILDTEEHATQPESGEQSEHDIGKFRNGFYGWLKERYSETSADTFITLFDIYWDWASGSTETPDEETGRPGYMPARRHLEPLWKERTGLSDASLYDYIGRLEEFIEQYVQENRHTLGEDNIFVKLIDSLHREREKLRRRKGPKVRASVESLNIAAAEEPKVSLMKVAKQLIRGDQLTPEMLQQVKDFFVKRWTSDNPSRTTVYHCDQCDINSPFVNASESAEGHDHPTIPLQTDAEWLSDKAFPFTNAGRLIPGHYEPGILANPVLAAIAYRIVEEDGYVKAVHPTYGTVAAGTPGADGRLHNVEFTDPKYMTNAIRQPAMRALQKWEAAHKRTASKTAEFGENVLPPDEAVMCKACGFEEAVPGKEYCEGCLQDVEHLFCPRCLECAQCNLRPCKGGGPHMPGVEHDEAWRMHKEMAQQGKFGAEEETMTLAEAQKQQLDVTFLRDEEEAERYAKSLAASGREVVAIWNETLPGATEEHCMLAARPAKHALGPLGLDTRKEGSEDADWESLHPNREEEEREKREEEFNKMRDYMKSLGWLGMNPWYPEKFPWWDMRVYSDGWAFWQKDLATGKEKRVAEGTTLDEMKKYLSRYDLGKLRTRKDAPAQTNEGWNLTDEDKRFLREDMHIQARFDKSDAGLQDHNVRLWVVRELDHEPTLEDVQAFVTTQTRKIPGRHTLLSLHRSALAAWEWKKNQKTAAVSGLGNKELLEATANVLEARRDDMLTVQDWEILQDAFDYASGDEPIPSILIALANLLDTHRMQPPMVTSEQWEEVAKAYEEVTGQHIEWRKADELSDEEWEQQYGDGVSLNQAVLDDREEQDQALVDRVESEPEPDKEAALGHDFYEGIRPQITPGNTGRVPHGRTQGSLEEKSGAAQPDLEAQVRIEWGGMYDSRHLELDGWQGTWEWTDYGASDELDLGKQIGPCSSVEEAKQKLQDFVFELGEPATYITYGNNEIVRKPNTVKTSAVPIDESAASGQERTFAETGGGVEIVPEQSSGIEDTLLDLLEQAARSLQEGTSDTGEDMNNPLAMEIEDVLNAKGRSMYGPGVASRLPKTAAGPEDFVPMFRKWLERGKRMLQGFVTDDKYLARSVATLHVYLTKMEEELASQMLAEQESKTAAGPITPQQMLTRNIQQSQGVEPEAPHAAQPPAGSGQPEVAVVPNSGTGEGASVKHTVPPEIPNQIYHMMGSEKTVEDAEGLRPMPKELREKPHRGVQLLEDEENLKSTQDTPEVRIDVEELIANSDATLSHENVMPTYEHGQWWATCGPCGAIWSVVDVEPGALNRFRDLDLEEIEPGDESCLSRHEEDPYEMIGSKEASGDEIFTDRKKFFRSVKHKYAGAQDFSQVGTGKTVREAFGKAVEDACYEHGHGGYTGSLAEKHDFVLITPPKGIDPKRYAGWLHRVDDKGPIQEGKEIEIRSGQPCPKCGKGPIPSGNFPKCPSCGLHVNSGRGDKWYATDWVDVPQEYYDQIRRDARLIEDKWGPAGAIQIGANKWLFFGTASS